ncbi:MAG: hypothetical protein HYW79_00585 [Parcubacteria group bacterium]|nr:hypothetical protein [Parcubacteria group bacterium]
MKKEKLIKTYDGKDYCFGGLGCPIVEFSPGKKIVKLSDPEKPQNGQFTMGAVEYNLLIKNAKKVKEKTVKILK